MSVIWKQNGEEINTNERSNIVITSEGVSKVRHKSILAISNLTEIDFGKYSCVGSNMDGTTSDFINIIGSPFGIEVNSGGYSQWATEYELVWSMESPLPPIGYSLTLYEYPPLTTEDDEVKPEQPTKIFDIKVEAQDFEEPYQESYLINENLKAGYDYLVLLQGHNKLGKSKRLQFPFRVSDVYKQERTNEITMIPYDQEGEISTASSLSEEQEQKSEVNNVHLRNQNNKLLKKTELPVENSQKDNSESKEVTELPAETIDIEKNEHIDKNEDPMKPPQIEHVKQETSHLGKSSSSNQTLNFISYFFPFISILISSTRF